MGYGLGGSETWHEWVVGYGFVGSRGIGWVCRGCGGHCLVASGLRPWWGELVWLDLALSLCSPFPVHLYQVEVVEGQEEVETEEALSNSYNISVGSKKRGRKYQKKYPVSKKGKKC